MGDGIYEVSPRSLHPCHSFNDTAHSFWDTERLDVSYLGIPTWLPDGLNMLKTRYYRATKLETSLMTEYRMLPLTQGLAFLMVGALPLCHETS